MGESSKRKEVKILGLGWARTGTMSFYEALRQLGYTPYHFTEVLKDVETLLPEWTKATDLKYTSQRKDYRNDVATMLADFDVVLDMPAVVFYDDLIEMYPDAKVILTTRDPDSWIRSMTPTIFPMVTSKTWRMLSYLEPVHTGKIVQYFLTTFGHWCDCDFGEGAKAAFLRHNNHVRQLVPPEQFLEFHPSQGWEPLCRFLAVPIPDTPFPNTNDTTEFIERVHIRDKKLAISIAMRNILLFSLPVAVGLAAFRRYRFST